VLRRRMLASCRSRFSSTILLACRRCWDARHASPTANDRGRHASLMLERLSIGSSQMIVSLPHLRAGQTAYQPKSPLGPIFCPWNRFGPRLALRLRTGQNTLVSQILTRSALPVSTSTNDVVDREELVRAIVSGAVSSAPVSSQGMRSCTLHRCTTRSRMYGVEIASAST
jgi:hypothetical protein